MLQLFFILCQCLTRLNNAFARVKIYLERVEGIEPSTQPWEGRVLPLNYTRIVLRYRLPCEAFRVMQIKEEVKPGLRRIHKYAEGGLELLTPICAL